MWDQLIGVSSTWVKGGLGQEQDFRPGPAAGVGHKTNKKMTANCKSSLQLCPCFLQEKGHQVLRLPAQAAGQPQIHDARALHRLRQCHLLGCGDQLPLPVALGFLSRGEAWWHSPSCHGQEGGDGGDGGPAPTTAQGGHQPTVLPVPLPAPAQAWLKCISASDPPLIR